MPIVNESSDAVLTCRGFGVPLPALSWFSNESLLSSGSSESFASGFGSQLSNISGVIVINDNTGINDEGLTVTVSMLTILSVTKSDKEMISYTCQGVNGIENNIGAVSNIAITLTVQGINRLV